MGGILLMIFMCGEVIGVYEIFTIGLSVTYNIGK